VDLDLLCQRDEESGRNRKDLHSMALTRLGIAIYDGRSCCTHYDDTMG
jgi:hypothetical protein